MLSKLHYVSIDLRPCRQHVRLHFFTNWAIAGGAVLLQCLGAGRFTVDSLIKQE